MKVSLVEIFITSPIKININEISRIFRNGDDLISGFRRKDYILLKIKFRKIKEPCL